MHRPIYTYDQQKFSGDSPPFGDSRPSKVDERPCMLYTKPTALHIQHKLCVERDNFSECIVHHSLDSSQTKAEGRFLSPPLAPKLPEWISTKLRICNHIEAVTTHAIVGGAATTRWSQQTRDTSGFGFLRLKRPFFFTARRLAKRGICRRRVSVCLSVCVCVCLSHSGIVSKRLNVGSRK